MNDKSHSKIALNIEKKLSLNYGFFIFFLLTTIFLTTLFYFKKIIIDEQKRLSSVIASSIGESINKVSFAGKYQARLLIEDLIKQNPNIHSIIIQDINGKILAHSDRVQNDIFLQDEYFKEALENALENRFFIQNSKDIKDGKAIDLIEIDMPYLKGHDKKIEGVIRVSLTTDILSNFLRSGLLFFALLIAVLTFVSIVSLGKISSKVSAPVKQLAFWLQGILNHTPLYLYISNKREVLVTSREHQEIEAFIDSDENRELEKTVFQEADQLSFDFVIKDRYYHGIKYPIVLDSDKNVLEVCTIALDITDRKNAEYELMKINKNLEDMVRIETKKRVEAEQMALQRSKMALMGEMMGAIAHQWRQPLNALGIIIQDIEEAYKFGELNDAYIQETIKNSMQQINFMSKTIDDFRSFFTPSKSKQEFLVSKPINDAIFIVEKQLKSHEISIVYDVDESIKIYGYKNELQQVILNLLSNAKDAIVDTNSAKKEIHISLEARPDRLLIIVEDSGGGISKDVLERITEPYFSTKEQGKGTGVGLYMSKQIIEKHMNGEMIFENGEFGAKVTIVLPTKETK